ncbi:MAG TPA: GTP cyclohydrolase I [Polyangiaceae bacterium]|jgi:GTP cyclohydrolase I
MDKAAAARAIDEFLIAIGRDPKTEPELRGTGARVADAFIDELCSGYAVDVDALLRGNLIAQTGGGIVELRDVAVTTTCPHHLMTGIGKATIGFAPKDHIVGVGALARLIDAFARRLTLQESIGEGVVLAIEKNISPRWVACRIEMMHACMTARGERTHGARLVTYAMRGDTSEAMHFVKQEMP